MATSRTPTAKKTTAKTADAASTPKATKKTTAASKPKTTVTKKTAAPKTDKTAAPAKAAPKKATKKSSVPQEARYQMIATAAYYLAEKRGFCSCGELDDWVAAEAQIDAMLKG